MKITVTNNGFTKDGYCNMDCKIEGRKKVSALNVVYFVAVLRCLRDADRCAFMNALEACFESELEQDDDEE